MHVFVSILQISQNVTQTDKGNGMDLMIGFAVD